jgi:hypothetical protein
MTIGLTDRLRDERAMPNEGIRRSARNSLIVGLVIILGAGLLLGLVGGVTGRLRFGLGAGLTGGLFVALFYGLIYGGAASMQHYMIRAAMARQRWAPWRYGHFLEAMTIRLLLRRAGSAYVFAHRLLRDDFAESVQTK